jgi:hypothetical protein
MNHRRKFLSCFAGILAVLTAASAIVLAAKPAPPPPAPPPEGTIFFKYNTNTDYSMKADGSGKTLLGSWIGAPSFNDYGGYRWFIRSEVVGDGQVYRRQFGSAVEPEPREELYAVAIDNDGNELGARVQLTDLYPYAKPSDVAVWSNRTDSFVSFLTTNFEYDAEGYRTRLYYSYDRLDISAQDLEASELPTPATLDDLRLWSVIPLVPVNTYHFNTACWSPDGVSLVYCSSEAIILRNAGTGDERVLCSTDNNGRFAAFDWAPSGNSVLAAVTPIGKTQGLYTLDASTASPIPRPVLVSKGTTYGFPVWSPDARHITASRVRSSGAEDIVRINADGSGVVSLWSDLLTSGGAHYPFAWCTDTSMP